MTQLGATSSRLIRTVDQRQAALRDAAEGARIDPAPVVSIVTTVVGTEHPDWTCTYVIAETPRPDRVCPQVTHGRGRP